MEHGCEECGGWSLRGWRLGGAWMWVELERVSGWSRGGALWLLDNDGVLVWWVIYVQSEWMEVLFK